MAETGDDRAAVVAQPPVLFFACLGVAWGLDGLLPDVDLGLPFELRLALAITLSLFGLALALSARHVMRRSGTPIDPREGTRRIVDGGPFRFTRNPLYLALLSLFLAIASCAGSLYFVAVTPALALLLHAGVVLPEERYLTEKFGDAYLAYKGRVRRWL